ncbi:hypothetical protein [Aquimarina sp. AU474]|uniref:hypothetical protein n=1 Tax=Aquimarina sp. AU474 TaxID=2108529 RepID=UPI000D68BE57|nr:hypothetical protein [Aquimarina sp. AU474]
MASKKDIGEIFREQLEGFNESPSRVSWEDIETKLKPKERYRIPYWVLSIGLLAIVLGAIVTLNLPINSSNTENVTIIEVDPENCNEFPITQIEEIKSTSKNNVLKQSIIPTPKTESPKGKINATTNKKSNPTDITFTENRNNTINKKTNSNVLKINQNSKKNIGRKPSLDNNQITKVKNQYQDNLDSSKKVGNDHQSDRNDINPEQKEVTTSQFSNLEDEKENVVPTASNAQKNVSDNEEQKILMLPKKDSLLITSTIKPSDSTDLHKTEKEFSPRFSIQAHIIPIYNFVPKGSLIDNTLSANSNTGNVSLGYGITLKSHLNKRFYSRIGYNHLRITNEVKNIKTDTLFTSVLGSIGIAPTNQIIQILNNQEEINLTQKINYHEIAMELGYDIIDKKVITSVVGGISLVILNNNTITASSLSNTIGSGRNNKISKTNFSINLGASFQYKLSKNIYFNVEPIAKYQLQDASNNRASYKPFYFTIQTGFSYEF